MTNLPAQANIGIFRALKLGDMLCAVPALRNIRFAYPTAHISLIGLAWTRQFVSRFQAYIDSFIEFPGYPGLPEQESGMENYATFQRLMQQEQFDLLLQMHGNGKITNRFITTWGAKQVWGFYAEEEVARKALLL